MKQQRKAAKTSLTKTSNKLQELIIGENPDTDDIKIQLDQLQEKCKILRTTDEKFLELLQKQKCLQGE